MLLWRLLQAPFSEVNRATSLFISSHHSGSGWEAAQGERHAEAGGVQAEPGERDICDPTAEPESIADQSPGHTSNWRFTFTYFSNDQVAEAGIVFRSVLQATLERAEADTRQRLNSQIEKQELQISQLQKRLEQEVEQRHLCSRTQEVNIMSKLFPEMNWCYSMYIHQKIYIFFLICRSN